MGGIINSIISGVATAVTWLVIVYSVNLLKNAYLEKKIRKSIQNYGSTIGLCGCGIILHNITKIPLKIRIVSFVLEDNSSYIANFSGQKTIDHQIALELQPGKKINHYTSAVEIQDQENERVIDLDFEMSGKWILPKASCLELKQYPIGAYILVEYQSLFNQRKTIKVELPRGKRLKSLFEHYVKECHENVVLRDHSNC